VPVLLLLAGTSLRYELHGPSHPNWREPPAWYGGLLWALVLANAAIVILALFRLRGSRIRAAGVLLPGLWLSLCALFPAAFAIIGVGP